MSNEIKALKEQRGQLGAKIELMLTKRINENRSFSEAEQSEYDNASAKWHELTAKIGKAESDRKTAKPGIGREDIRSDARSSEKATLGRDDSFAAFIRSHLPVSDSDTSVGAIVQALAKEDRSDADRRSLSEGTDSAGGYTVPTLLAAEFIDKLRTQAVVTRAGASIIPLTSNLTNIAKLTGDVTASWTAEAGTIAASDPTFGRIQFAPKKLGTYVKVSRELLEDSVNAREAIETSLTQAFALALDSAALFGTGSSNQPTGVFNTSGINSVSMGANGAAITDYSDLLDAIYEVELDNSSVTAAIAHPRTMKTLNGLVDSQGQPMAKPSVLASLPFYSTTGVPINQTQGSASNASSIIMGRFSDLLIGMRSSLTIKVLEQPAYATDEVIFLATLRADVALAHNESFVKLIGIIP